MLHRCERGCTCEATTLEGHHSERTSLTFIADLAISQAPACVVSITVEPGSSSGGHKVKVIGVIVSEEAGDGGDVATATPGVVIYTHDIASRDKDGMFDARNWA